MSEKTYTADQLADDMGIDAVTIRDYPENWNLTKRLQAYKAEPKFN